MIGLVLVAAAAGFTVIAVDAVVESAPADAQQIILFGTVVMAPGRPGGLWILIGLVAIAAIAWTAVAARSRGRGLDRRMAIELDTPRRLHLEP